MPDEIKNHFITSKHLVLYSWFVYRFIPVAELHAITSLEYALKLKTGKTKWGLKRLLTFAVKEGWVLDNDFFIHRQKIEKNKNHEKTLKHYLNVEPIEEIELIESDPIDNLQISFLKAGPPIAQLHGRMQS